MTDNYSYMKKDMSVKYRLEVEYIDDAKDWDRIVNEKCAPFEPWELYKKKVFDEIGEGISFYIICLFNERIYDAKLFFSTFINDEMVEERHVEPTRTLYSSLANMVDRDREHEIDDLRRETDQQSTLIQMYESFVRRYHAEKEFEKFMKEYREDI